MPLTSMRQRCWLLCLVGLPACDRLLPFGGPSPVARDAVVNRWDAPRSEGPAGAEQRRLIDAPMGERSRTPDLPKPGLDKPMPPSCGPCTTCCLPSNTCAPLVGPNQCGAAGQDCIDCHSTNPCKLFTCQKGACVPTASKVDGAPCGAGQICCSGSCCPPFITTCPANGC